MSLVDPHAEFLAAAIEEATLGRDEGGIPRGGVLLEILDDRRCIALMQAFIQAHPELWNEDIGV